MIEEEEEEPPGKTQILKVEFMKRVDMHIGIGFYLGQYKFLIGFPVEKFYLHPIYFSIHPIKNTHREKYKFTLKSIFSISFFFFFISLRTPTLFFLRSSFV